MVSEMTPERKAELEAMVEAYLGPPPPKPKPPRPKVVVSDGVAIRDADVVVSPKDPNARRGDAGVVSVRRFDRVTIDMAVAEVQWWDRKAQADADVRRRREADPFGMGH